MTIDGATVTVTLRDYLPTDEHLVDALGVHAFEQYQAAFDDWTAFRARIAHMSTQSASGELIVAELAGRVVGAVAYFPPGAPKPDFFRPEWPIMRMLVVAGDARGHGIGHALAEECLARAWRDGATQFALHTSELMQVALPMYLRMGFERHADAPTLHGVKYAVYLKALSS